MRMQRLCVVTIGLVLMTSCSFAATNDEVATSKRLPPPERDLKETVKPGETRTVVFAGGCFWCTEAVFEELKGVKNVVSGFAGGTAETAHYDIVSSGGTQHAESVEVTYDPAQISYGTLLQVLFNTIHPTQREGQGPDQGHQYRAAIFYQNEEQKGVAEAYIQQLEKAKLFDKPMATSLEPLSKFYPAEEYHQDYVQHHPNEPYVRMWSLLKLEKLRRLYPELIRAR